MQAPIHVVQVRVRMGQHVTQCMEMILRVLVFLDTRVLYVWISVSMWTVITVTVVEMPSKLIIQYIGNSLFGHSLS